jgi:hypothetical protein
VRASVIIVNWNAGQALLDCLASVSGGGDVLETIVVDNASTDGSLARARESHPPVRIVETGANLGFAAGANRGAAVARGDALVFLNPDARVEPGAIDRLVGTLGSTPGAGIAGGGLVGADGRWQPGWARFHPIAHLLLDTTPGRFLERGRRVPHVVDWVYGTFMAVRRDAFRQLGGFDESYFLYGEDLDLCHRATSHGLRTVHVPDARAVHGANVSAAQRFGLGREAAVVRGEMRFYARRGGPGQLGLFRLVGACKFGMKAAFAAALGRWQTAAACARVTRACLAGGGVE